jgi:hypothetical protein
MKKDFVGAISVAIVLGTAALTTLPAKADFWSSNVAPIGHAINRDAINLGKAIKGDSNLDPRPCPVFTKVCMDPEIKAQAKDVPIAADALRAMIISPRIDIPHVPSLGNLW